jgi:hypothetical protein
VRKIAATVLVALPEPDRGAFFVSRPCTFRGAYKMLRVGVLMSSFFRRLLSLEIRIRRRWHAPTGVYAVVRGLGKHQIDDIGFGGLSFHYSDDGLRPNPGAYGVSIRTDTPSEVVTLKVRTVSDQDVGELIFQNKKIKRRSVRFEPLNYRQKKALKTLIKTHLNHGRLQPEIK